MLGLLQNVGARGHGHVLRRRRDAGQPGPQVTRTTVHRSEVIDKDNGRTSKTNKKESK